MAPELRFSLFCVGNFFTNLFSEFSVCGDVVDIAAGKNISRTKFFLALPLDAFFLWLSISARRGHQPPKTSQTTFLKLSLSASIFEFSFHGRWKKGKKKKKEKVQKEKQNKRENGENEKQKKENKYAFFGHTFSSLNLSKNCTMKMKFKN